MNEKELFAANKKLWDGRVEGHFASPFYDVAGFLNGKCTLMPPELEALGDVSGKSLLHLQCHFGLDSLSWARRGAVVTGVDFSAPAIAKARALADDAHLQARFVESDVYDLPHHLEGQFDIVFASYGTLLWLPDLERWAEVVCHYLKPGGRFCLVEFHPQWHAFNWETLQLQYPYFNQGKPLEESAATSYAGAKETPGATEYFWNHSIAEILQPLLIRGIRLQTFREYPYSTYNCFPDMEEVRTGQWVPRRVKEGDVAMMLLIAGEMEPR